jgi:cation diffusion facilitator CzcD-associated flavoprotein CzcO
MYPADVIVLANGFLIGGHLAKLDITGNKGRSLLEYWTEKEAVSSYKSAAMSEFPNFFMLDGPNSASGHFSVIYTVECQVNYVSKLVCL